MYIKIYIFVLVVINFCINVCWSIGVPKIAQFKQITSRRNTFHRVLKCVARGDPMPIVSWTFQGQPIEENEHYELKNDNSELTIKEVTTNDTGHYRCYASNSYGMIFAQLFLKVVGVGEFEDGYTKEDISRVHNVTIGRPVRIKCPPHTHLPGQIYGWGIPPLEIFNPGKPVERVFLSDFHGTLYFSYITADDIEMINVKGGISCLLYEDFTNLVASVKITLQSDGQESTEDIAPEMVMLFANDSVAVEGTRKVLRCGATGRPHPIFKWYKDGKLISSEDGTRSTVKNIYIVGKGLELVLLKVKKEDAGLYKCVATNSEGTDSKEATLIVHSKVSFVKELRENYNIPVKETITLKCAAKGFPEPKYIWYHNNTIIGSNKRRTINDGTMEIPVSGFGDCGMYLCTAANNLNTIVSPAYVKIEDVAPVFVKKISGVHYYLHGDQYGLSCDATGGPEPTLTWYWNDKLITNSKQVTVAADGNTLFFKDVTKAENGVYKCVAENRKDKIESSAVVKVFIKTTITKNPGKVRYNAGRTAYLFCDAVFDTSLKATWQWLKDGKVINYDDRVYLKDKDRVDERLTTHTLKLNDLTSDDAGEYTCKVFTVADATFRLEDSAVGSITVITAPLAVGNLKISGTFDKDRKTDSKKQGDTDDKKTDTRKPGDGDDKKVDSKKPGDGDGKTTDTEKEATSDDDGVTLSWDEPNKYVGPADKYIIEYAKANSSDWKQYDPPNKFQDTSVELDKDKLPASSDVVFRIKAVATDRYGTEMVGEPSNATKAGSLVTPTKGAPLVVGNLKISGTFDTDEKPDSKKPGDGDEEKEATSDDDGVTLSWDEPTKDAGSADKYIIEYAKANSSDWKQYDPPNKVEGTSVELDQDKLPASSDVVFRIKAVVSDKDGTEMVGEASNATKAGSLVTPTRAPKAQPSNVRLEMEDGENATIIWDKLDEVDRPGPGFKVVGGYREISPKKESEYTNFTKDGDDSSAAGPAASDDGVDREYEVFVATKNNAGQGPLKKKILKVPGEKPNRKVTGLTLVEVSTKGATVKWNELSGVSGYRIYYYTKKESSRERRNTQGTRTYIDVTDTKYTISDLKPGSEYEITVAARNLKGAGPKSDPLPVKTKNGVPGIPSGVNLDTYADTVKVGWGPPDQPDIKNYTVTWYPKNDPTKKKTKTVPYDERQAFITDKDMDPQEYYTVEVAANSDEGEGKPWVMEGVVIGEADIPGKPAPPFADAINETKINVTFRLPSSYVGGLPKTFKICYSEANCFTSKYPDKPYVVVASLDHTVTYEFWSVAINDLGTGEKSEKVSMKPLDPPTTPTPPTTTTIPSTTNATTPALVVIAAGSTDEQEKAFYEETWFIILLIILLVLIIIAIILCIICNRRGGRYPVGKKEKDYGGWDKDPMKDYSDNAIENGGADLPLISPSRSPGQDSLKKPPFDDDDEDSLADYGEGYGDMGQYGTDTKKEKNGQTFC